MYGYCPGHPDGLAPPPDRPLGTAVLPGRAEPSEAAAMRGGAAALWAAGCDGLFTWFARWPHSEVERAWLGQIGGNQHPQNNYPMRFWHAKRKVIVFCVLALNFVRLPPSDPDLLKEADKVYAICAASESDGDLPGYPLQLPVPLTSGGPAAEVSLFVADDTEAAAGRLATVRLELVVKRPVICYESSFSFSTSRLLRTHSRSRLFFRSTT